MGVMPQSKTAMTHESAASAPQSSAGDLLKHYHGVRSATETLCAPLSAEDCTVQSMPDASPVKWHLAHTTWFFEFFVLSPFARGYRPFREGYEYLFNSYYFSIGEQYPRRRRGVISRPGLEEVREYRRVIDERVGELLLGDQDEHAAEIARVLEVGLNHEQQHQELILTDVKHALARNPLFPAYREELARKTDTQAAPLRWHRYGEGIREVGHGGAGFCYDNETPRHRVFLEPYELASRPVTNGEFLGFIDDGGYERPDLWLSDGWTVINECGWKAPIYWVKRGGEWFEFTLGGLVPLDPGGTLCHVSHYEAEAFARWAGARLPTEAEWESAAAQAPVEGNFVESGALHPAPASAAGDDHPAQLFGDVWEWTGSAYLSYPGYRPLEGALGEYNGKFMANQLVLRGGSCATPRSHIRASYRNFFYPDARWQFAGVRLARSPR